MSFKVSNAQRDDFQRWLGTLAEPVADERLQQAARLATLGQMASEVAHELNQPLSAMRLTVEEVLEKIEGGAGELPQALDSLLGQIVRMSELVKRLGSYGRGTEPEAVPFSPVDAIHNVVRLVAGQFKAAGVELALWVPPSGCRAIGRSGQLEQVILNLLANARDAVVANPPAGAAKRVALTAEELPGEGRYRLVVEDNGGGVPEALWPKLFEPFFTTKPDGGGTGLGLSISADIVRMLGGRLVGENTGEGARFTVLLPVARRVAAGAAAGERVLLVDDETEAAGCAADYLRRRGYRVATAADGIEALALFAAEPADVVVSDLRMPGVDGLDLVRRLRQRVPGLPVVLMTGKLEAMEGGAAPGCVVVPKPLSLKRLEAAIAGLIAAA